MKPVAVLYLLLLLACHTSSYGQGENNVWCFGYHGGMDFNNGSPVFFSTNINAIEGCASISDANGNLLFYASTHTAFSRNNVIMPNGDNLNGDDSYTQGAAIIQSPLDVNQYYLFSGNVFQYGGHDVFYSVVDMTLNGGYGDIIVGQKNIPLDSNMMEKMILVSGCGCSNWLLLHYVHGQIFHAFKIDAAGLSTTPVISNSGFFMSGGQGEMKISPDGKMLVLAGGQSPYLIELDSFDKSTGVVSNGIILDTLQAYGTSFSPDGSKLYFSTLSSNYLVQYDLSLLPDIQAVKNSKTIIDTNNYGGLRIGPDNKIYVIHSGLVYVINNPNAAGLACNFNPVPLDSAWNGFTLGNSSVGVKSSVHVDSLCTIDTFVVSAPECYDSYLWSDGSTQQSDTFFAPGTKWVISTSQCSITTDTFHIFLTPHIDTTIVTDTMICLLNGVPIFSSAPGFTSYLWSDGSTSQTDTMSIPGTKWVMARGGICDVRVDTFHLHAMPITTTSVVKDTNVCFVNNVPIFSAPSGYDTYLWSDGKTTQQDSMSQPGTKWVQAQTGCTMVVDTFHVHDWRDTTKMAMDTSHCVAYSPIPVTAPGGYTSYVWSDGHIGQTDTFFSTMTKWVTALNGCNMLIDTVHFTATTIPQDSVSMYGGDTTLCFDNIANVNVTGPDGYTFYLWNDGTTTQTDVFNGPGTKWVYAQKLCYLLVDTFHVFALPTDTVTGITDTMICFSNAVTLGAVDGYDTYLWSDGTTTQTNTFTQTGIKEVNAHKACAERIDSFKVQFINDLSVDLGPDSSICKGETLQLDATSSNYPEAQYLWQDGKTTAVYNVTEGGDYSVSVNVGPCTVSDTVKVHQKVINIDLGKGLIPCHGESLRLDAGVDSASYLWQDGSSGRTYTATKAGSYSVTVTQGNCSATASVMVKYEGCPCHVLIATAFSPNNDSRNDQFGVTLSCDIQSFKLMIYNRWGNQVFYSEDVNEKWDGTSKGIILDGDVFNYYAEFKDVEGKMYYYKGTVTLVR